jgi:Cdc6-like AAA superfamily ATPase
MVILLSNSPRLMQAIDPSARSTLQPAILHFRNYDADQLYRILRARAEQGLHAHCEEDLSKIAALTRRNTNSDVRVAIKCLFYKATEPSLDVDSAFEQASRDVVVDVVRDLNDKCLIILESVRRSTGRFVKDVYRCYKRLSDAAGETPFSYMHFYNNLSYLQSCGLIILVAARVARTYTNRIRLLADAEVVADAFKQRFA